MSEKNRKLNWKQACEVLGCGKTHFYNLVNSGKLQAFRSGDGKRGLWLWEADCLALIKPVGDMDNVDRVVDIAE